MASNNFKKTLESVIKTVDNYKYKSEPFLDKALSFGILNLGSIYATAEIVENNDFSNPTNGLITLTAGGFITAANYLTFVSDKTKNQRAQIKKLDSKINENRIVSWIKTAALASALYFTSIAVQPYANTIYDDIEKKIGKSEKVINDEENKVFVLTSFRERPEIYDFLSYKEEAKYDFTGTKLAPKNPTIGRIQRTLRWEPVFRAIEKKYDMPPHILAGMIMQESYGDPIQPNMTNDGGLGVVHIQGTTGKLFGLKIYGNSNRDTDHRHGTSLRKMITDHNYNLPKIASEDERAHLIKVLDGAARIISEGKAKHGTWAKGIEYYRHPYKVGKPTTTNYRKKVEFFRDAIKDKKLLAEAEKDFNMRNKMSFDDYISRNHEMCRNWGLETYKNNYEVEVKVIAKR